MVVMGMRVLYHQDLRNIRSEPNVNNKCTQDKEAYMKTVSKEM